MNDANEVPGWRECAGPVDWWLFAACAVALVALAVAAVMSRGPEREDEGR